jgi:hypothetical protein
MMPGIVFQSVGTQTGAPGFPTATPKGFGAVPTATAIFAGGTSRAAAPSIMSAMSIMGVVIDEPNKRAWFTKDGINFYGVDYATVSTAAQVAAGTGGFDATAYWPAAGASVLPAVGAVNNPGKVFTSVNYPWPIPSGYAQL